MVVTGKNEIDVDSLSLVPVVEEQVHVDPAAAAAVHVNNDDVKAKERAKKEDLEAGVYDEATTVYDEALIAKQSAGFVKKKNSAAAHPSTIHSPSPSPPLSTEGDCNTREEEEEEECPDASPSPSPELQDIPLPLPLPTTENRRHRRSSIRSAASTPGAYHVAPGVLSPERRTTLAMEELAISPTPPEGSDNSPLQPAEVDVDAHAQVSAQFNLTDADTDLAVAHELTDIETMVVVDPLDIAHTDPTNSHAKRLRTILGCGALVLVALALGVGLGVGIGARETNITLPNEESDDSISTIYTYQGATGAAAPILPNATLVPMVPAIPMIQAQNSHRYLQGTSLALSIQGLRLAIASPFYSADSNPGLIQLFQLQPPTQASPNMGLPPNVSMNAIENATAEILTPPTKNTPLYEEIFRLDGQDEAGRNPLHVGSLSPFGNVLSVTFDGHINKQDVARIYQHPVGTPPHTYEQIGPDVEPKVTRGDIGLSATFANAAHSSVILATRSGLQVYRSNVTTTAPPALPTTGVLPNVGPGNMTDTRQMPPGMTPPAGVTPPEGMTPPAGMTPPEGGGAPPNMAALNWPRQADEWFRVTGDLGEFEEAEDSTVIGDVDSSLDPPPLLQTASRREADRFAVGFPKARGGRGLVRVYQFKLLDDGQYTFRQIGTDMVGTTPGDGFGAAVSCEITCRALAVGTQQGNYVQVFTLMNEAGDDVVTESSYYAQVGDTLWGQQDDAGHFGNVLQMGKLPETLGACVSCPYQINGRRVVVGSPRYKGGRGRAIVYQYHQDPREELKNQTGWYRFADDIVSSDEENPSVVGVGYSVALSPDQRVVAVGSGVPKDDTSTGEVRLFRLA